MLGDLYFSVELGVLIEVKVFLKVVVHGGVIGGEAICFSPSLLECLNSVKRTSPGDGGGKEEPPELREEATDSVESAPV